MGYALLINPSYAILTLETAPRNLALSVRFNHLICAPLLIDKVIQCVIYNLWLHIASIDTRNCWLTLVATIIYQVPPSNSGHIWV